MSWLIALFSKEFRARYEDEIVDLLETTDHPALDRADLLRTAVTLRLEDIMQNKLTLMLFAAVALASGSLVAMLFTIPELAGGVRDIPKHWWSSAPLAGLAVSAALGIWIWRRADH